MNCRALRNFLLLAFLCSPALAGAASVRLDSETLFQIHARFGPYQPEERAQIVSARLLRFADAAQPPQSIRLVQTDDRSLEIEASGDVLITLTDHDAAAESLPLPALGERDLDLIRRAVTYYREQHSTRSLVRAVALSFALTLLLLAGLLVSFRAIRVLPAALARSVRIQNAELLSAGAGQSLLRGTLLIAWFFAALVALDFYLPFVLDLFPATRPAASGFAHWTLVPLAALGAALLAYLPDLVAALAIAAVAVLLLRFSGWFFRQLAAGSIRLPGFYAEWSNPTDKLVRFLILALAFIVIGPYLPGAKSPGFQGVGIFLGVLLSLGSSSAVANVVAGVILTYTRAFQSGDRVAIGETTGDIVSRTLLVTQLRTIKNEIVTIPNGAVLGAQIKNYSAGTAELPLLLHTSVTIGYDVPWRTVHSLLIAAAGQTPGILYTPEPFVLQTALNDFSVAYEINAATAAPHHMVNIYGTLHENIQTEFNRAGIEILSPNYIAVRDGNKSTSPES